MWPMHECPFSWPCLYRRYLLLAMRFLQTINGSYVDGVSLTYGNSWQHIWSFANALDEAGLGSDRSRCTCTDSSRPNDIPSFVGSDYFCETEVKFGTVVHFMLTIPCGMVEIVVQVAITHHGFVDNYLSQLMLIWKSDCVQRIHHLLKTLQ